MNRRYYLCNFCSLIALLFLLCGSMQSIAADVSLAWERSTTVNVTGYRLYYGSSSRNYGTSTPVGNVITYTVPGLSAGTYYFAVTAVDTDGNESDFSNEVSKVISGDTTKPVISSVLSSGLSVGGALITWTTDEAADSTVEYGTSTAYGSTVQNGTLATSHAQTLTGLISNTLYHYRVTSKDAAGNLSQSGDYTFTTSSVVDSTKPVISAFAISSISSSGAVITWTTNEPADTRVDYGTTTSYGGISQNATLSTSHSVALTGLAANTLYHCRAVSKDAAGNESQLADYTFITEILVANDTSKPVISAVTVSNITTSTARFTWTTNEVADTKVEYGTTASYGSVASSSAQSTSHLQNVNGLTANTLYHFRVISRDGAGNEALSEDRTFSTAASQDTTIPTISSVVSRNVSTSSAVITWTTNEPADSQIEYGSTTSYGGATALDPALLTSHSQTVTGLNENREYHFRVKSRDAAGNEAVSVDYSFKTPAAVDSTRPVISNVSASDVTSNSAIITWTTDEIADSQVEYGFSTAYGSTSQNGAVATSHSQMLTGLNSGTQYHYRVKSKDSAGNEAVSGDNTFTTSKASLPPVISEIVVSGINSKSATISWTTDKPSDSAVDYWTANGFVRKSGLGDMVTRHSITVAKLQRLSEYFFIVKSADADGNQATAPQSSFKTTSTSTSGLVLPRFASGPTISQGPESNEETMIGIALANLGSTPAPMTLTAVDDLGNLITGTDIVNPKQWVLNPNSQFAILDMQIFGEGLTAIDSKGWIKLESTSSSVNGFFLTFDGKLSFMDGANFGDAPMKDSAFTEIEPSGSTRINIANSSNEDAAVNFSLVRADGTVRRLESRMIPGNGAFVADLYQDLFPEDKPEPADYVLVRSSQGVQPFELMQKRMGDISSLTGQDISAGATTLYSPQYVVGGPWKTSLSIINLESRTGTVMLRFFREDGVQIGTAKSFAVPSMGKLHIDDPNFFVQLDPGEMAAGYIEITTDGIRITGSTVFQERSGQTFCSALPLIYQTQKSVLFSHVASNDQYFTGIAILNPNPDITSVQVELHGADGSLVEKTVVEVRGNQRIARLLTEYFPSLLGKNRASGYVRLTASNPIVSFSLIGTNNLSVLSALPPQEIQ